MEQQLSPIESLLILGSLLVLVWILAEIGNRRLGSLARPDLVHLMSSSVAHAYFCPIGHFIGEKRPKRGEWCQECVNQGIITAVCRVGGVEHSAHPVDIDHGWCDRKDHGLQPVDTWTDPNDGRTISRQEVIDRFEPIQYPMPIDDPLPADLLRAINEAVRLSRTHLEALDIVGQQEGKLHGQLGEEMRRMQERLRQQRAWEAQLQRELKGKIRDRLQRLEDRLTKQIEQLEMEIGRRQRFLRWWYPLLAIVVLAVLVISVLLLADFSSTVEGAQRNISALLDAVETLVYFLLLLTLFWLLVLLVMVVPRRLLRGDRTITRNNVRLSFVISEILALVILPSFLGLPVTLSGVTVGFLIDVAAEATTFTVCSTQVFKHLKRQGSFLWGCLAETRASATDLAKAAASVYRPTSIHAGKV